MYSVKVISTGSYTPSKVVSNDDLTSIVETSDEWITTRSGIKSRRISTGENTSEIAAKAALEALKEANLSSLDIDLLIVATTSPDSFTPSTACIVQEIIGAKNAVAFDISAACSGFIFALNTATKFLKCGEGKRALVIGAEVLSKIMDWTDRSTCVLFGDGAGAAIIESSEEKEGILATDFGSDGTLGSNLTTGFFNAKNPFIDNYEEGQHYIKMNGREIFKFAVKIIPSSVNKVLEKANISLDEIKYIVPHQANLRIVEAAAKRLDVPMEKFFINLDKYGNTSAATIPIALDELNKKGLLQKGDKIVLVGFGGGLTWGSALIEW